ncbi:hypothetical protein D1003_05400 [Riemerella anatipestifer]|nr:hypothetical protein [Riemerella anatipestifer]
MSCRNDSNENIESKMENYTLKEQSLRSLSPFSINFNIKRINIDKINNRRYKVSSLRAAGRRGNPEIVENTNVSLEDNLVVFSTAMFSNLYSIKKDVIKGTLFFNNGKEEVEVTNEFIDTVKGNDAYVLKRLIALYIELYDTSIRKMGGIETMRLAEQKACAEFESSIGFTSSAAAYRARYDAVQFINDGHGDCKIIGTDVSCVTDSHICFATVTMACNGATCN